jgi:hypothetical protein
LEPVLRQKLLNVVPAAAATVLLFSVVAAVGFEGRPAAPVRVQTQPVAIAAVRVAVPIPRIALPKIATAKVPIRPAPSVFRHEQAMSHDQLMARWNPFIAKAANRFDVPVKWIREVMRIESGGRTMMAENVRMVSTQGAEGLMQLLPATYAEMRTQNGLGADPFDPHDNIFAGAAYLRWLRGKYGYPVMFEAYDDGPGNLEQRITSGALLPAETQNYVRVVRTALGDRPDGAGMIVIRHRTATGPAPLATDAAALRPVSVGAIGAFTRPDGTTIYLDCKRVSAVRAPLVNEYVPEVKSVITVGALSQGVQETEEAARQVVRSHGGQV